jgi:hypothetical protein
VARVVGVTMAAMGVAGAASAQVEAVEWRVEDGGNGHWYQLRSSGAITWPEANAQAIAHGGHLATVTTDAERQFIAAYLLSIPGSGESAVRRWGPWFGARQIRPSPASEPDGGWSWVTDEPWQFTSWGVNQPDNLCLETGDDESYLSVGGSGMWNDLPVNGCDNDPVVSGMFEWSADCDQNGLVDYGEIVRGEKTDANANGIPDCCESSAGCCPGDVDGDGAVNGIDLAIVLARWGGPSKDYPNADANDDGTVDGADLAALLGAWGPCE